MTSLLCGVNRSLLRLRHSMNEPLMYGLAVVGGLLWTVFCEPRKDRRYR